MIESHYLCVRLRKHFYMSDMTGYLFLLFSVLNKPHLRLHPD